MNCPRGNGSKKKNGDCAIWPACFPIRSLDGNTKPGQIVIILAICAGQIDLFCTRLISNLFVSVLHSHLVLFQRIEGSEEWRSCHMIQGWGHAAFRTTATGKRFICPHDRENWRHQLFIAFKFDESLMPVGRSQTIRFESKFAGMISPLLYCDPFQLC